MNYELHISKTLRNQVFTRDQFTCQMCGATEGEPHHYDPSKITRICISRIEHDLVEASNDPTNLRTLCSICYGGVLNILVSRPTFIDLKTQMMRAAYRDQIKLLEAMIRKFPGETIELALNRK